MKKEKPTFASVTNLPCKCRSLQMSASHPEKPISFDKRMNEYHINYGNGGYLMVYHCPFCGGAAPKSRRGKFFAVIPEREDKRLFELTKDIKTMEEAIAKLGKPDFDAPRFSGSTRGKNKPMEIEYSRCLIYKKLSDFAEVQIFEYGDYIRKVFSAKYIGPKRRRRLKKSMKKFPITDPVAEREIIWIRKDGVETKIIAKVGRPYQVGEKEWACPMHLAGVDLRHDCHGAGSIQALVLAINLIRMRLGHLLEKGEKLYYEDRKTKWTKKSLNNVFGK
jgi:hypothetical protein